MASLEIQHSSLLSSWWSKRASILDSMYVWQVSLATTQLTIFASHWYETLHAPAHSTWIFIFLYSGHAISFFGNSHNLIEKGLYVPTNPPHARFRGHWSAIKFLHTEYKIAITPAEHTNPSHYRLALRHFILLLHRKMSRKYLEELIFSDGKVIWMRSSWILGSIRSHWSWHGSSRSMATHDTYIITLWTPDSSLWSVSSRTSMPDSFSRGFRWIEWVKHLLHHSKRLWAGLHWISAPWKQTVISKQYLSRLCVSIPCWKLESTPSSVLWLVSSTPTSSRIC